MGAVMMLYVIPMMLGQTYDKGKETVGIQIFNSSTKEHSTKIENYFTDINYRMIDDSRDAKDFLDVGGKLSLNIKSGMLKVDGEGSYLRDKSDKANDIEILAKVHFETITRTIPTNWKPNADWTLEDKKYLGTHYCRSITYGGDLIASLRFSTTDKYDKEHIKGAIQAGLNAKGINAEIKGQLEKIADSSHGSTSMEINYYATVPIPGVSHTIDGLIKLIEAFPEHVKKVNNGIGNPLRMELHPLTYLQDSFVTYYENSAVNDKLDDMENQFDDLRTTQRDAAIWMSRLPPAIPAGIQEKINSFLDRLQDIYTTYCKAILELDVAVTGSIKPFEEAFAAYKKDGDYIMPRKYSRRFHQLQQEIYEEEPKLKPRMGGALYVHWGKDSCGTSENIETVVSGVSMASLPHVRGSFSQFTCISVTPELVHPKQIFGIERSIESTSDTAKIGPIQYRGSLKKYAAQLYDKNIACAMCRVRGKAAVLQLPSFTECPNGWTKEYDGLMMAPGKHAMKGEYVCVDKDMKAVTEKLSFGNEHDELQEIQEISVACGALPCGPYKESTAVPCVVCTR